MHNGDTYADSKTYLLMLMIKYQHVHSTTTFLQNNINSWTLNDPVYVYYQKALGTMYCVCHGCTLDLAFWKVKHTKTENPDVNCAYFYTLPTIFY